MRFEEIADPLERVKRIIATHLRSMTENSLCFDTQLYIAQLKQYGSYFFTQDRYITRIMRETVEAGQQAGEFDTRLTASEIVKRLLNFFAPGWCIITASSTRKTIRRGCNMPWTARANI